MDDTDPAYAALQQLTAYWLAHPLAADTLDGICQWWITDLLISRSNVESALNWLTQRGVVAAQHAADGRVRYRLMNPAGATGGMTPL